MNIKLLMMKIVRLIGAAIVSVLIMNVFCFFYGYTGVHMNSTERATDYVWQSFQIKNEMGEGFAFF